MMSSAAGSVRVRDHWLLHSVMNMATSTSLKTGAPMAPGHVICFYSFVITNAKDWNNCLCWCTWLVKVLAEDPALAEDLLKLQGPLGE